MRVQIFAALLAVSNFPESSISGRDFIFSASARQDVTVVSYCTYMTTVTDGSERYQISASVSRQGPKMLVLISGLPRELSAQVKELDVLLPEVRVRAFATERTILDADIDPQVWKLAEGVLSSRAWSVRGITLRSGDRLHSIETYEGVPRDDSAARLACLQREFQTASACLAATEAAIEQKYPQASGAWREDAMALEAAGNAACQN